MDISKFSIEDFIYDTGFRKWVLEPDPDSLQYWNEILLKYPYQAANINKAKAILLKMESGEHDLEARELDEIWEVIDCHTRPTLGTNTESKIIPLHSKSEYKTPDTKMYEYRADSQFLRVAAILIVSACLGMLAATFNKYPKEIEAPAPLAYEEHHTPRGVKSFLTLSDGSTVILNSGSSLKYVKGFDSDRREVFLSGEAFFKVFKDTDRPFIVRKEDVSIEALGTAFNVEAYGDEDLKISLVTGKVAIALQVGEQPQVILEKGESLQVKPLSGTWVKGNFAEDEVLGWTKKIIVFKNTPVSEAIRVLENWYSIDFRLENQPAFGLLISGRFEDETLENVLHGLRYTTQLQFEIKDDVVNIKF